MNFGKDFSRPTLGSRTPYPDVSRILTGMRLALVGSLRHLGIHLYMKTITSQPTQLSLHVVERTTKLFAFLPHFLVWRKRESYKKSTLVICFFEFEE